ncbi:MAG: amidohydrolase [Hyphomicrobiales bacterium]|nr:MAG: amidohydrolase [Hyphomicrobiales bacterium]
MQIDCDIHPGVPDTAALFPYMPAHWRDTSVMRGIDDLQSANYPDTTPLTVRPDWRPARGRPGTDAATVAAQCLDPFGSDIGILNPLFGVQTLYGDDLAAAYASALNGWTRGEFLDRDSRFRASIIVSLENIEMAVAEIDRCAVDPSFVQVMLLAGTSRPLGRRQYWPIYEACVRHGLSLAIHAGQEFRNAPTALGWPSYYLEDYTANAQAFQYQLTSLFCEGVFEKFPTLTFIMLESGWTWVPALLWRIAKYWGGLRFEVPWTNRSPEEIVRDQLRFSLTPVDGPADGDQLRRVLDHLGSDRVLLFSTDYPHNQFDGADPFPDVFDPALRQIISSDAPLAAYPRLGGAP